MKKSYQLSATEAAKKIQGNQLSSEELLRSCIARIEEKESSTQATCLPSAAPNQSISWRSLHINR